MKTQLIRTKQFLLLIDSEARAKVGLNYNFAIDKVYMLNGNYLPHTSEWNWCRQVIAYLPLSKFANELNVPLLPTYKGYKIGGDVFPKEFTPQFEQLAKNMKEIDASFKVRGNFYIPKTLKVHIEKGNYIVNGKYKF